MLLVLLLDAVFAGAMLQVTAYPRSSPADAIVSQQAVRTMHMSMSALPADTAAAVARVDGVAWAEAIRFASSSVSSAEGRQLSYLIGYDPGGRAGPQHLSAGRPPRTGEALLDAVAADRLGVTIGGTVQALGQPFTVSGLFQGGTSMVNTTTFIPTDDFARLRGPAVSYVLVGARRGITADELVRRLSATLPNTTVQTRERFVHEEAAVVADMSADVMRIMTVIALLIALAVIGLTLFTLILAKLREHAVVKALGGTNHAVGLVVAEQAV